MANDVTKPIFKICHYLFENKLKLLGHLWTSAVCNSN